MIKIIVPSKKVKEELIAESRYLHDIRDLQQNDYDMLNSLMHLHMLPDEGWIVEDELIDYGIREIDSSKNNTLMLYCLPDEIVD